MFYDNTCSADFLSPTADRFGQWEGEEDGGPYASFWGYARLTKHPTGPGNEARGEAGEGVGWGGGGGSAATGRETSQL